MIDFTVSGDEAVIARLKRMSPAVQTAVSAAVTRACIMLTAVAKAKVSGPVLKTKTGTLRRKINYRVVEGADSVVGTVGLKLAYGAIHEYGFDGSGTVKSYQRTIKEAFGHAISPRTVVVRSFTRHMKMPERSYLRSSLAENKGAIRDMIAAAVTGAVGASA